MASGNDEEGGLELGIGEKIPTTVMRWSGKNQKGSAGSDVGEGDSGWDYDQVPSGYRRGINKRGIDSGSGPGGGKNDMLDDSRGKLKEGELVHYLQSTKIRLVGGPVLHQIPKGRTRPRC